MPNQLELEIYKLAPVRAKGIIIQTYKFKRTSNKSGTLSLFDARKLLNQ